MSKIDSASPESLKSLLSLSYTNIPTSFSIFYLDTCVWGKLLDENSRKRFIKYFSTGKRAIVISQATFFELSRAYYKNLRIWDDLFFELRHCLYTPPAYELVIQSELASFPEPWKMVWLFLENPISISYGSILQYLANESSFLGTRDDYRSFGFNKFMKLEELKKNFPPLHGEFYTVEDANNFSWAVTINFLVEQFPHFAKKNWKLIRGGENGPDKHIFDNICSLRARLLFLFFKYYLHRQSPGESDFF